MKQLNAHLTDRSLLKISGSEARSFLQNLITNDMDKVTSTTGIYAFLLSAQGKYLHDFFVLQTDDGFLLITAASRQSDLKKRLTMLKLRADVSVAELPEHKVIATWPLNNEAGQFAVDGKTIHDGRGHNLASYQLVSTDEHTELSSTQDAFYDFLCDQGIPTPHLDFVMEKTTMMEAGLDGQFAVSWTKGCFVGQELTARVKYRGLVKRLLISTQTAGKAEEALMQDGKQVGTMQSRRFAHIKRDAIDFDGNADLQKESGGPVFLIKPDWWDRSEASLDKAK